MRSVNGVAVKAVVSLYASYPVRPPIFRLTMCGAAKQKSKNKSVQVDLGSSELHLIEIELNRHYDELLQPLTTTNLSPAYLLSCQIRRLQMCLDVVAGGESATSLPGRARRGKDRRPALKWDSETNSFSHR